MTKTTIHSKFISYSIASVGLLLVALGIALSIKSNLGTSSLSSPAYIIQAGSSLTVGNWNIIVNMVFMLVQMAILRRDFKASYLMQIPASLIFGYLIDLCLYLLQWLNPALFVSRVVLIVIACAVTALGVSIEVFAKAWMLSAEMTVFALTTVIKKRFGTLKVWMDTTLVVISAAIAFIIYRNPFGFGEYDGIAGVITGTSEGVVIGLGTMIMALLTGWMMKFTDPVAKRMMDIIFGRFINRKIENEQ